MSIKVVNSSEYKDISSVYTVQNGVYVPVQNIYIVKDNSYNAVWQNSTAIGVYGAVNETVTFSDGTTCTLDSNGLGTAYLKPGVTVTATGSVSGYTTDEQTVTVGTPIYVMPTMAYYWYGNKCAWNSGGWSVPTKGSTTFNKIDTNYSNSTYGRTCIGYSPTWNTNNVKLRSYTACTNDDYLSGSAYSSIYANNSIDYTKLNNKTLKMKYSINYYGACANKNSDKSANGIGAVLGKSSNFTPDGKTMGVGQNDYWQTYTLQYYPTTVYGSSYINGTSSIPTTSISTTTFSKAVSGLTENAKLLVTNYTHATGSANQGRMIIDSSLYVNAVWFE